MPQGLAPTIRHELAEPITRHEPAEPVTRHEPAEPVTRHEPAEPVTRHELAEPLGPNALAERTAWPVPDARPKTDTRPQPQPQHDPTTETRSSTPAPPEVTASTEIAPPLADPSVTTPPSSEPAFTAPISTDAIVNAQPTVQAQPTVHAQPSTQAQHDVHAEPTAQGQVASQVLPTEPHAPANSATAAFNLTAPSDNLPSESSASEAAAPPAAITQQAQAEPPAPGSLADLRRRLERLPFGHPSSPYHVDGERKPPPPRLKHLELAPPAPRRFSATAGAAASANWPSLPGTDDEGWPEIPAASDTSPSTEPAPADGIAELNGSAHNGSAHNGSAHNGSALNGSAFNGDEPHDDDAPPAVLPAPSMAPNGSWSWGPASLTQDQVQVADEAYDRFRAAEGRSLFGSYGDTGITTTMRRIAGDVEFGQLAPNTEETTLLEPDIFRARFADMLRRYPERSPERLARRVPAAISYSFVFEGDRYAEGIWLVQDALSAHGFQLLARRNDWNSAHNRCVATMWHDPGNDLPFEVQFHTSASLEAQQLAKSSATLINDPRIPPAEATHLKSDLAAAWAALPAPPGGSQITNYRRAPDGSSVPG